MKTTQIIIEHLIAGIQMLCWIACIIFIFVGIKELTFFSSGSFETIVVFFSLSLVYPLGIIIDNIADKLLKPLESKIRKSIKGGEKSMRQLSILLKDPEVEEQFDYIRSRIRICRSAFLNFGLLTLFGIILTSVHLKSSDIFYNLLISEFVVGGLITILSFYSWKLLTRSFYSKIAKRHQELEKLQLK